MQLHNLATLQLHYVISFAIIKGQDCIPLKRQIVLASYTTLSGYFKKYFEWQQKNTYISKTLPEKDSSSLKIYPIRVEC